MATITMKDGTEIFYKDWGPRNAQPIVMHGEDDQIVPVADSGALSAKLIRNAVAKFYPGFPHGMATTHADQINTDLLAFIKS